MKWVDIALQRWRYRKIAPYMAESAHVLDVGCFDGSLFRYYEKRRIRGVGIDRVLPPHQQRVPGVELLAGDFPAVLSENSSSQYDVITMLAVLEHVPPDQISQWVQACHRLLKPSGVLLISVPSPKVDHILSLLLHMRLIHGMSLEEHHGFDPSEVPNLFSKRFVVQQHHSFQLGLNHLYVLAPKA